MSTSRSSTSGGNVVLPFALGVSLTVCLACVCFDLTIVSIGFWYLTGGVALQAYPLILFSSSEVMDPDVGRSSFEFDSWTPSNVGFLSKFGKKEYAFAILSSKICRSLTLITLFYSSIRLYKWCGRQILRAFLSELSHST